MTSSAPTEIVPSGPALALLEVSDLPAGFGALDAVAKAAEVRIVAAGTLMNPRQPDC